MTLELQPKQTRAFLSRGTEQLYGGAAGGGKSHLMRVAAISWCLAIPGLQVYIFRRTYPDLWQNHMEGPTGFPQILAEFSQSGICRIVDKEIRFHNGSKIYLRHCQYPKDVLSYQGAEIHVLMIDELTQWQKTCIRVFADASAWSASAARPAPRRASRGGRPSEQWDLFPRPSTGPTLAASA